MLVRIILKTKLYYCSNNNRSFLFKFKFPSLLQKKKKMFKWSLWHVSENLFFSRNEKGGEKEGAREVVGEKESRNRFRTKPWKFATLLWVKRVVWVYVIRIKVKSLNFRFYEWEGGAEGWGGRKFRGLLGLTTKFYCCFIPRRFHEIETSDKISSLFHLPHLLCQYQFHVFIY